MPCLSGFELYSRWVLRNNVSSNLVECIDFSGLSGATLGWSKFRINNVELKCSFVQSRKYHQS